MKMNRRVFATTLLAGAAAAVAPTALAHAPEAGKRAQPGFYRFKLGTIEITVVSDGTLAFPTETPWGDRAEDARGLLTSTFHTSRPEVVQINTTLVNTGDKLMLIDAGCGVDKFQNTTGRLLGNLAAAGYAPGDIDMILFSLTSISTTCGASAMARTRRCCSRRPNSSRARLSSPSGAIPNCPAKCPPSNSRWLPRRI